MPTGGCVYPKVHTYLRFRLSQCDEFGPVDNSAGVLIPDRLRPTGFSGSGGCRRPRLFFRFADDHGITKNAGQEHATSNRKRSEEGMCRLDRITADDLADDPGEIAETILDAGPFSSGMRPGKQLSERPVVR